MVSTSEMTLEQQKRLIRALTPRWSDCIPHAPTVRQHAALLLNHYLEGLYGGAAGGGKSDYLLMAALQYADVPGYSALLLRRTFPQLSQSDGLLLRAQEWLTGRAEGRDTIGGVPTRWVFQSGAQLQFGHVQHEKDRFNYQGGAWQFVGFDELTQFSKNIYLYLFSRVRRPKDGARELSNVPLRIRSASNPGGEGHDWVRERFVTGTDLGEDDEKPFFIPARLTDNPHLDSEEYARSLRHLHPVDRAQLLEGDWDVRLAGSLFQREWFGVVPTPPIFVAKRVRAWDLAATQLKTGKDPDFTVGTLMSKTRDKKCTIENVRRGRWSPNELDNIMLSTAQQDPRNTEIWIEEEPGSSGKIASAHFRKVLAGFNVHFERPTGSKTTRAMPYASYAEGGGIDIVRAGWNREWLDEHERFNVDPAVRGHDDQVDSADLGFAKLFTTGGVSWADLYGKGGLLGKHMAQEAG